jgi:hypothetical protein
MTLEKGMFVFVLLLRCFFLLDETSLEIIYFRSKRTYDTHNSLRLLFIRFHVATKSSSYYEEK